MFKMIKALFDTSRAIKKSHEFSDALSALPMPDLMKEWVLVMSKSADGAKPKLRPPASGDSILRIERALGVTLPGELGEFYQETDGIDWSSCDYRVDFVAVASLRPSGTYNPPLSKQIQQDWEEFGREDGEPEGLAVYSTSVVKLMAGAYEEVLPFQSVDEMLALTEPKDGSGAVIVVKPHQSLPIGTVLEIENITATRYNSIRQWLAQQASVMAMLHKESER